MNKQVNLIDICNPKQWKTISTSDLLEEGYPVYGANGKIGFYSEYTHEFSTVLITCRGATCGTINICEPKSYVNGNAMALDELDSGVDLNYLFYVLKFRGFDDVISGSAQPQITRQNLKNVKIPLPPLGEQQKIAAILDAADSLRQKDQQLVEHYTALSQSLFLEMFGDPVTNPMGWRKDKLGGLTDLITDGKHGDCENETSSGYFFISAKDINNQIINYSNARQIRKNDFDEVHRRTNLCEGDLVMVNTGATIGKIAIATDKVRTEKTTFQKSVAVIKPKKSLLSTIFLKYLFLLRIDAFASKGSGSAVKNLLLSEMRRFEIILPELNYQNQFAERIQLIEAQKQQAQASLEKSEALFNSLLQRAFTGELTAKMAA